MEEKFAELKRNRSHKLAKAEDRAMELNSLRIHQPNELEPSVPMLEGGASGLSRVRGRDAHPKEVKGGFFGPLLASLAVPVVSKVLGLGKKSGMKCGGQYVDKQFGIINDPKPMTAEQAVGVAKLMPMEGSGYGKKMKKQGMKSREDEKLAMEIAHMKGKGRAGAGRAGAGRAGAGHAPAGDKRKARGDAVRKLMQQHGMTLPQASKHLKENGY